jgi:hypothetical protein
MEDSSSELSDVDLDVDLEMESIPIGPDGPDLPEASAAAAPPDAEDSDEGDLPRAEGGRLGILYDFLLTQDQITEVGDEWTIPAFIQELAAAEAELFSPNHHLGT